jgi:hypothetical protein
MRKTKQWGRITLRVKPDTHREIDRLARVLGLNANGVVNLLINRSLGQFAAEAHVLAAYRMPVIHSGRYVDLLEAWRKLHPSGRPHEFIEEFRKMIFAEPSQLDGLVTGEDENEPR